MQGGKATGTTNTTATAVVVHFHPELLVELHAQHVVKEGETREERGRTRNKRKGEGDGEARGKRRGRKEREDEEGGKEQ